MAAMVGARRALLAARYSPRGAIAASATPVSPYRLADSPPRLLAERRCVQSWIPHRAAGNLASERTDEDYHREWGQGNSRSNHFDHQLKRDAHSAGSTSGVNIGGSSEQPYRSGASYGFPNSNQNQTHTGARANNEQPGYNATQPYYRTSSAYSQQSLGGHLPNAHQQYNGAEAKSTPAGYGKGQTYHHPNGYGTYDSGYSTQSNRKTYKGEGATTAQYGYGPSGQGPNSVGNGQQVFQQQQYVDHRSRGGYPDRPGNPTSQYANPTHFRKEHVTGFQQGSSSNYGYNAPQSNQSPYFTSQVDTRSTQVYSMYLNTDVQRLPNGIRQEKHSHVQPTTSFGNHLNSAPHQGGVYYQPLPGNPSNDSSPSEVSNEVSSKHKGTVEELEKLCEDGNVKEAMEVLALLQENGTVLHAYQYFRLMQACGDATALEEARVIHSQISESSITVDTDVQNKILEMYAKCGSMEDAKKLFSTMDHHNLASWNTMISGFVQNGHGEEATDFFDQFKQTGDKPDPVMFTHIFLACGIMGSVDEGMLHFEAMQKDFGIIPTMEHYASIVSMLGQSGYIAEAHEFVEWMPVEPSIEQNKQFECTWLRIPGDGKASTGCVIDQVHQAPRRHPLASASSPRKVLAETATSMAAAAGGGARRALAALRSGSPSTLSATLSRQAASRSPELAAASLPRASRRRLVISRVPVAALGCVQGSLMPMHSATASALLTSMLGLKPGSWGWLSEVVIFGGWDRRTLL
ncbi:pentatricopeptide repeat-containing protein [Panicum miliaceum]|uniref:Pentatricopeptide repeat-containing protein n=1 Tax=Panicum miliaceum TaxID=4540 RepID=A0A3L6QY27_PANMI|nr:pentatricopeptide repeat-containing protein [Panicum miliaceum]